MRRMKGEAIRTPPQDTNATELRYCCTPPRLPLHSGSQVSSLRELIGETKAALNSTPNELRTQRRSRRETASACTGASGFDTTQGIF